MASRIMLALSGACLLATSAPVFAGDTVLGREVSQKLCVNCHIVEERGPQTVNPAIPSFKAIAEKPGQSEDAIETFLIDPHYPMPDIQLTAHEIDNIAAYIMSLGQ